MREGRQERGERRGEDKIAATRKIGELPVIDTSGSVVGENKKELVFRIRMGWGLDMCRENCEVSGNKMSELLHAESSRFAARPAGQGSINLWRLKGGKRTGSVCVCVSVCLCAHLDCERIVGHGGEGIDDSFAGCMQVLRSPISGGWGAREVVKG
jgi:hypothetical protein